jgi:hypothetical protein
VHLVELVVEIVHADLFVQRLSWPVGI